MLQIIQLNPTIGNVVKEGTWQETSDVVKVEWVGVGTLWCYGRMWEINNAQDLDEACEVIAGWPNPPEVV